MPRRRQQSGLDDLFDLLKVAPIWVGPVLAVVVLILLRFVVPSFLPNKQGGVDMGGILRPMFMILSWVLSGAVVVAWAAAELWKLMNRRLLDRQTGLASIRDISWREFELLVSEAYRRKGYLAEVIGSASGDGGVDIRLTGHGETVLVQCKQWKAYRVGVTTVRELLGVVVSKRANRGIVVTSGRFTREAREFAQQNRQIKLVDGAELAELIRGVQPGAVQAPTYSPATVTAPQAPHCPFCGAGMLLRTARNGHNAGSQFWGCSKFSVSGCRGTRQLAAAKQGQGA